ncbi:IS30 family transposase [Piscinibacter defluvii]|uniref:IS30 family transposase n=1 Tax=Piscinibacter defluvii TaxID=1796922 RepID=UPI000FDCE05D|nr:IS30 family transposase [Piscinibacter defluvii]
MEQSKSYRQLTQDERVAVAGMRLQQLGVRRIARELGRSPSTISRELRRNGKPRVGYRSDEAQRASQARRRKARPARKLDAQGDLWLEVLTLLEQLWSPQQIAATLKQMHPGKVRQQVSHETIYTAIYAQPRGELRRQLIACLRQGKGTRRPRSGGADRRGRLSEMVSIHLRPPEVQDRTMPGHWEGDLLRGAGNQSAVGVLYERASRVVLLAKLADATADSALAGFTYKLNSIAAPMRKTLTYDQGKEMAHHRQLAAATGIRVYFCDPHSPWQRAGCENINGLLRQYLPKGADLSSYSQDQLDAIADSLNTRPRATLDWDVPIRVYARLLAQAQQPSGAVH